MRSMPAIDRKGKRKGTWSASRGRSGDRVRSCYARGGSLAGRGGAGAGARLRAIPAQRRVKMTKTRGGRRSLSRGVAIHRAATRSTTPRCGHGRPKPPAARQGTMDTPSLALMLIRFLFRIASFRVYRE